MIADIGLAVHSVEEWIAQQARKAEALSLVLGISGGVDSAVVAGLCARTGFNVIGVIMPCHSSPASEQRAAEVVDRFNLHGYKVNLEAAHESISSQVMGDLEGRANSSFNKMNTGALRSCLRAPTLDYVAKMNKGIIVGTGNRDEDEITRYYQKRGDGCVDISPIAKFHKSEIYQLAKELGVPQSVIVATPSADLWGPDSGQEDEKELGMAYADIEWAMQFAARYSSIPLAITGGNVTSLQIRNAVSMAKQFGVIPSEHQLRVLEKLVKMEETSRHKANPALPVFQARTILHLDEAVAV